MCPAFLNIFQTEAHTALCPSLSFKGYYLYPLYPIISKQPWNLETLSLSRAKGMFAY